MYSMKEKEIEVTVNGWRESICKEKIDKNKVFEGY